MKRSQERVTIAELARALITMTENGYGDCPLYVSTARDVGPLAFLLVRRRNSSAFLCEEQNFWSGRRIELRRQGNGEN